MTDQVGAGLARLTRVPGVRAAAVVDAEAGVPVAADVASGISERALAALAGSLFNRARESTTASGVGGVRTLQMESEGGHLVMAGAGALLVAVLTEPGAQLGLVRVQAARVAGELMA